MAPLLHPALTPTRQLTRPHLNPHRRYELVASARAQDEDADDVVLEQNVCVTMLLDDEKGALLEENDHPLHEGAEVAADGADKKGKGAAAAEKVVAQDEADSRKRTLHYERKKQRKGQKARERAEREQKAREVMQLLAARRAAVEVVVQTRREAHALRLPTLPRIIQSFQLPSCVSHAQQRTQQIVVASACAQGSDGSAEEKSRVMLPDDDGQEAHGLLLEKNDSPLHAHAEVDGAMKKEVCVCVLRHICAAYRHALLWKLMMPGNARHPLASRLL